MAQSEHPQISGWVSLIFAWLVIMQVSFSAIVERAIAYSESSDSVIILPAKTSFPFSVENVVVPYKTITNDESLTALDLADYIVGNRFSPLHKGSINASTGNYQPFRQLFLQGWWQNYRNSGNYLWSAMKASNSCWRFPMVATVSDDSRRNRIAEALWFRLHIHEDISTLGCCEGIGSCKSYISSISRSTGRFPILMSLPGTNQCQNRGKDYEQTVKYGLPPIARCFIMLCLNLAIGFILSLLGWQYIDNNRRRIGLALIGVGLLSASA